MYIDILVLIVFIVFILIYSKRFQTYIFGFGMIDIIFRILNVISGYIPIKEIRTFIDQFIPSSVPGVIDKYMNGILCTVFMWIYVFIMILFLYYIITIFFKRKKI